MAISSTYASPVTVNGYSCRSCNDVSMAQRHIDPAHPRSGPFGINAAADPSQPAQRFARTDPSSAIADRPSAYSPAGRLSGTGAVGSLVDRSA